MTSTKQTIKIFDERSALMLQTKVNRFLHEELEWEPLDVTFGTSFKVYEGGEVAPSFVACVRYNKKVK